MASSPIPAGSMVVVEIADENDPESPLEGFLCSPPDENQESDWVMLGNSFGAETRQHFIELMKVYATFHGLPFIDNSGEPEEDFDLYNE